MDPLHFETTDEFADVLQHQKDLLDAAKKHRGKKPWPALKRSRQTLINEFTDISYSLAVMALQDGSSLAVSSSVLGEAYEPSSTPLAELDPIRIDELLLETHHRGRVLIARTFTPPNRKTTVEAAIEDEHGDVERLAVYNLLLDVKAESFLPAGTIVAIKEPYLQFTEDEGLCVRVDHPSDMVKLPPGDARVPEAWRVEPIPPAKLLDKARDLQEGTRAFGRQDWRLADALNSEAYEIAQKLAMDSGSHDFSWEILRSRAAARLNLGRYETAIQDALDGLVTTEDGALRRQSSKQNTKALCRAAEAAYGLGDFELARKHFEAALILHRDKPEKDHPKHIVSSIQRCNQRMQEQAHGDYDFAAMVRAATAAYNDTTKKRDTRLDHASFLANTRIGPSAGKGRGLFTTKAIKAGEVVFVEKAFHIAHAIEVTNSFGATEPSRHTLININTGRVVAGSMSLLLAGLAEKLAWNPSLAAKYFLLDDGVKDVEEVDENETDTEKSSLASFVDGMVPVDIFRAQSIVEINAFSCPRIWSGDTTVPDDDYSDSAGVWLHASYANHACISNAHRAFIGDMMIVRAVRNLAEGEEVSFKYVVPTKPFGQRMQELRTGYGFACDCALCTADAAVGDEILETRAIAAWAAEDFLHENSLSAKRSGRLLSEREVPAAVHEEAAARLAAILDTYPDDVYGNLPRLDCLQLDEWRCALVWAPEIAIAVFLDKLRHIGYNIILDDGGRATVDRSYAVALAEAIYPAQCASVMLAVMGKVSASASLRMLAWEVYTVRNGTDVGFEEKYRYQ